MAAGQTPSQTVGPFFSFGLAPEQYGYDLRSVASASPAHGYTAGATIRIVGCVLDGEGTPAGDALVEIWQADAEGRYAHPADGRSSNSAFRGFARAGTGTDPEKRFNFETVMPGSAGPGDAPHINVVVFARGMLNHLFTRIYFEECREANAGDRVLQSLAADRRDTLLARRDTTAADVTYRFDIRLQGDNETVFFDV